MSRIHEALKKAEEEKRYRSAPGDAEAIPLAGAAPVAAAAAVEWSAPAGGNGSTLPGAEMLQRCVRRTWNPDQRTMLFFGQQEQSVFSEGFRTLRTRLYQVREKRALQKVLVSSALPGEGKTFVSANLAQAFVRQGHRVLLIDADLRLPQVHAALGAPATPGLSDYLRGKADEFAIVQHGPLQNLFFIPGGSTVSDPAELIASPKLKVLLDRLSPAFDWLILDSPPAVPVADASILAGLCDGVILVVEAASTPVEMAQKARYEFRDRQVLGVVLNRVHRRDSYGSYAYYSLYGRDGRKHRK